MKHPNYHSAIQVYRKILLYIIKLILTIVAIVAAVIFILALADVFAGLQWGYTWWAIIVDLAIFIISLVVRSIVTAVLVRLYLRSGS